MPPSDPVTPSGDPLRDLTDRALDAVVSGMAGPEVKEEEAAPIVAEPPGPGDLLWVDGPDRGELRRLTIMFCDLVGSTALSGRHDPERYRRIIGRYRRTCRQIIEDRFDGYIAYDQGDGMLALFGHPTPHEDDALRAVQAGLDIVRDVAALSEQAEREVGESLAARVGIHHGLVYLDLEESSVYGLTANVASRLQDLAAPGSLVVSETILQLVTGRFELEAQEPAKVKGVEEPLGSWRVIAERPPTDRAWSSPLVGRTTELNRLRQAWRTGAGAVLVRGEPGSGKSRLVARFTEEIQAEGAGIVVLTGSAVHAGTGYQPIRTLIEGRCGIDRVTGSAERVALLARHLEASGLDPVAMVPLLGPILDLAPSAGYTAAPADARKLNEEVAAATARYLTACVANGPTLLVAEDIQWFDDSTRDLLGHLVRTPGEGVLIVMTSRTGGRAPARDVEVVEVPPLTPADSATLVANLDPAGEVADQHADLLARADGIPLFLEELVHGALASLESASPSSRPDHADALVPNVLHEPLMARLPASVAGRRIAAVAATIGRGIDLGLLRRTLDVDEGELTAALQDMEANRIIERVQDGGTPYRFRHELVREVAYEAQLPSVRREVHGLIADALAGDGMDEAAVDWVVLAGHQERAGRFLPAAQGYANAADAARRRGGLPEAIRHLDRALEVLDELPDGAGRREREIELLLQRGFLAVSTQGNASPQAAADYERCLDLAMRYGSRFGLYSSLISVWGYYMNHGDLLRGREVLDRLASVATGDYAHMQTENQAGFGILDWFGGSFLSALDDLEAAAAAARERPPEKRVNAEWTLPNDPCSSIHTHLATARFLCGDPRGAAQAFDEAFRYAHELTFPYGPFSALYAESYVAWIALERGDLADAEANMLGSRVRAEAHGFDFFLVPAATIEARLAATRAAQAGEPVDVLIERARALDNLTSMWLMLGTELLMPQLMTTAAGAWARAGDLDTARQRLDEASAHAASTGLRFYESETQRVRAATEADLATKQALLLEAFETAENQGATAFALRIARDLHDTDRAAHRSRLADVVDRFAADASYPELDAARTALGT